MAKKKAVSRKSARAPRVSARAAAVRAPRAEVSLASAKGDLSLPSAKGDKKKWLYVLVGVVVLLALAYYFMGAA